MMKASVTSGLSLSLHGGGISTVAASIHFSNSIAFSFQQYLNDHGTIPQKNILYRTCGAAHVQRE